MISPLMVLLNLIMLLGTTVGPVLLLVGLIGRRDPCRPQCRACRHRLTQTVVVPESCPSCNASLQNQRAVRFCGWRPITRPLIIGLVMVLLAAACVSLIFLVEQINRGGAAAQPATVVNNIRIERDVTPERFAEQTADLDEDAWAWIEAHLTADALSTDLKQLAADLAVDLIIDGRGDAVRTLPGLIDYADVERLANARADQIVDQLQAHFDRTRGLSDIGISSNRGQTVYMSYLPIGRLDLPHVYEGVIALAEIRADGVALTAAKIRGRVISESPGGPFNAAYHDPDNLVASAETVELDFAIALYRELPDRFRHHVPGPPDTWPEPLAMRRVTVEIRQ